jgi:hypothetical protein
MHAKRAIISPSHLLVKTRDGFAGDVVKREMYLRMYLGLLAIQAVLFNCNTSYLTINIRYIA